MSVYKRYKGRRLKPGDGDWGRGRWWMEFRLRGHDVHESIAGARTRTQAERAETSVRESIYDGKFNKGGKTYRFDAFVDEVFMPWARGHKLSWQADECRAKTLKAFFGRRLLRDITPMLVKRFKSELMKTVSNRGEFYSPASVNQHLKLLGKILETAFEEELIDSNPVRRVPLEAAGEPSERYLTFEEEAQLLAAFVDDLAPYRAPVVVDIDTGLRLSELFRLQVEHINFGERPARVTVNRKDVEVRPNHLLVVRSKNGRPRTIPLTERARKELSSAIQDRTFGVVFDRDHAGVHQRGMGEAFRAACELAGIPYGLRTPQGMTFHRLRHTFSTRLADLGVHETTRMALLGHSTVEMTRHYTHATPEATADALRRLSQAGGRVLDFRRQAG